MAKVIVALGEEALMDLQEVLIDGDPGAALEFVRRHVAPQIPEKGTSACDSTRTNPFLSRSPTGKRRKEAQPPGG
jgi:hypothetical protein